MMQKRGFASLQRNAFAFGALSLLLVGPAVRLPAQQAGRVAPSTPDPLDRFVSFTVHQKPLSEAIEALMQSAHANYIFSSNLPNVTINASLNHVSVRLALDSLLKASEPRLMFRVEGGICHIFPVEKPQEQATAVSGGVGGVRAIAISPTGVASVPSSGGGGIGTSSINPGGAASVPAVPAGGSGGIGTGSTIPGGGVPSTHVVPPVATVQDKNTLVLSLDFTSTNLFEALTLVMKQTGANYTIADSFKNIIVTAHTKLPLRETLDALGRASGNAFTYTVTGGVYNFLPKAQGDK